MIYRKIDLQYEDHILAVIKNKEFLFLHDRKFLRECHHPCIIRVVYFVMSNKLPEFHKKYDWIIFLNFIVTSSRIFRFEDEV